MVALSAFLEQKGKEEEEGGIENRLTNSLLNGCACLGKTRKLYDDYH